MELRAHVARLRRGLALLRFLVVRLPLASFGTVSYETVGRTQSNMTWMPFDSGLSIGSEGSESGTIVTDFEHELGARITIERDGHIAPYTITSGIYGWFVHTRFLSTRAEANTECAAMQTAMDTIIQTIPLTSDPECDAKSATVSQAISDFVDAYP